MTRQHQGLSRLAFALAFLLVLAGFSNALHAGAQDATPVAQPGTFSTGTEAEPSADTPDESTENGDVSPASVVIDPEPEDPETPGDPASVFVFSYLCASDPGGSDPLTAGCSPAIGVPIHATDDNGLDVVQNTDSAGAASFSSVTGAAFDAVQQAAVVLNGCAARGDGHYEIQSLQGDTTLVFINVIKAELGRLQLVAGICPTTQENRTEFTISQPAGFGPSAVTTCGPNIGAIFTIASDALAEGSWAVRIEADGSWRGYVPTGTYIITAADGSSTSIYVAPARTSVAVAITYVNEGTGTLVLEHFVCTEGTPGEQIEVNPAGAPDPSCSPSGTTAYVTDTSVGGAATPIVIAQNGSTSLGLKPGSYQVTSASAAVSTVALVEADGVTTVRLLTIASVGSIAVQTVLCPANVWPTSYNEFIVNCTSVWPNRTLTVSPAAGVPFAIETDANGSSSAGGLQPGIFTISGSGVCGVYASGVDTSSGFSVSAGAITHVTIFGCYNDNDGTSPGDGSGNGGSDGSGAGVGAGAGAGSGGGDGTGIGDVGGSSINDGKSGSPDGGASAVIGGDGTGIANASNELPYGSNGAATVTQLPNTGGGLTSPFTTRSLALFFMAALMAGAGIALRRQPVR